MQGVLDVLEKHRLEKEAVTLQKFYDSVKTRADKIADLKAKQKIIVELYDKFFRNAFPKLVERLGIVYTPVEVVDFIIHSVNDALKHEFGQTLGSKNVHIIDPFTGTGTFIARLLQSGLISKDELAYKYQNEIHANEIVLLAYYIAAINIEQVYHSISGGEYVPFNGICLTDTFALYEKEDLATPAMSDNSGRRKKQKELDIRVIMGNPPYSIGQRSENDGNANIEYKSLDGRILETYAHHSNAMLQKGLYDSYIRALRWASDRIKDCGVIGFVSNAGWLDANTADGLRKCLAEEFSSIYVFHLRGNQRTSGELSRKEGGKIFGGGSRTPIAISILVKNPKASEHGKIYFHDIGDYLSREEKLERIDSFGSIAGITHANQWQSIAPDRHHDWLAQRDDSFVEHISLGDKKDKNSKAIFENFSLGVATNRDAWVYNSSKNQLSKNVGATIDFYNTELERYKEACAGLEKTAYPEVNSFINTDKSKISWSSNLIADLTRSKRGYFSSACLVSSMYRPYQKQWLYFNPLFNSRMGQMPRIFPNDRAKNLVICVTGQGAKHFGALMANSITDLQLLFNGQCFPLNLYEPLTEGDPKDGELFSLAQQGEISEDGKYSIRDGISDSGLAHFQEKYPSEKISKEDLFYYIYGLLHSEDYRARYNDNLSKELPRIPAVKAAADFWFFSKAGRALADLHLNYESAPKYPVDMGGVDIATLSPDDLYVTQMKYAKGSDGEKWDKTQVIYNHKITLSGIPLEAYEYVVNGKPALEWVRERQSVSSHKDSGIVNDANLWARETMHNPAYPLELFQRVITVSLETMKIVNSLPVLDI
jgi:predicted helicase